jgi:hypothetical protein
MKKGPGLFGVLSRFLCWSSLQSFIRSPQLRMVAQVKATYTKTEQMISMARWRQAVHFNLLAQRSILAVPDHVESGRAYSVAPYGKGRNTEALWSITFVSDGAVHLRVPGRAWEVHVGRRVRQHAPAQR